MAAGMDCKPGEVCRLKPITRPRRVGVTGIDTATLKRVKVFAAERDVTIGSVVTRALGLYLESDEAKAPIAAGGAL